MVSPLELIPVETKIINMLLILKKLERIWYRTFSLILIKRKAEGVKVLAIQKIAIQFIVQILNLNFGRNRKRLLIRAGNEARTRDPQLGKLMLYQLSYSRL